ncbi:MAG: hypothetical protein M0Z31_13620 [Clostridia bacterium]|nr:hypothetical protein [Clostridia bacterium]
MDFLGAGLLAAGMVWAINRFLLQTEKAVNIMFIIPGVEELAKTGLALFFNSSVLLTHGVFGTVEAIVDVFATRRKGIAAGLVSYLGHFLFGLLTILGQKELESIWAGLGLAYLAHASWNVLVIMKSGKEKVN